MKLSYEESYNKRVVRDQVFKTFSYNKIIGLGGPSVDVYINELKDRGFEDICIYENNPQVFIQQLQKAHSGVRLVLGDIHDAPIQEDVLYDMDFCCNVVNAEDTVKKFNGRCIWTFCLRPLSVSNTIRLFCSYKEELIKGVLWHTNTACITTNKGRYYASRYSDGANMIMIYN